MKINKKHIYKNANQIYSLIIKDLKLRTRFKDQFVVELIIPLLTVDGCKLTIQITRWEIIFLIIPGI